MYRPRSVSEHGSEPASRGNSVSLLCQIRGQRAASRAGPDDHIIVGCAIPAESERLQKFDQGALIAVAKARFLAETIRAEIVTAVDHVIRTLAQIHERLDQIARTLRASSSLAFLGSFARSCLTLIISASSFAS